jgi:polyisoprenoid-binding protein YceI
MKKILSLLVLFATVASISAQKIDWALDKSHSNVGFSVTHMVISNTTGLFTDFDIKFTSEGKDFSKASVTGWADVKTVNTNNADRDAHLQSEDFFYVEKYPRLEFTSTAFEKITDTEYKVHGNLTMRGVTKPVIFTSKVSSVVKDPWGNYRIGWKAEGEVNRTDWGIAWNKTMEAGSLLDVTISINFELMTQSPPQTK